MSEEPTAKKIVEEAIETAGLQDIFDEKTKDLFILVIEYSIRMGYIQGYEDSQNNIDPKTTREKLIKLYYNFKKQKDV